MYFILGLYFLRGSTGFTNQYRNILGKMENAIWWEKITYCYTWNIKWISPNITHIFMYFTFSQQGRNGICMCKSKISWCSKHSGEKTSLNQPSEQNTYDLIASPAKESRCKCKNRCKAENSGDDGIENNSIGINGKAIEILEEVNSLFNRNRKSFSLLSRKLV